MPRYEIHLVNGGVTYRNSPLNFRDFANSITAEWASRGKAISRIINTDWPDDLGEGVTEKEREEVEKRVNLSATIEESSPVVKRNENKPTEKRFGKDSV